MWPQGLNSTKKGGSIDSEDALKVEHVKFNVELVTDENADDVEGDGEKRGMVTATKGDLGALVGTRSSIWPCCFLMSF